MKEINTETVRILTEINEVLKGRAFIVGGALRSLIEGELPRDIDIFMATDNNEDYVSVCHDVYNAFAPKFLWSTTLDCNTDYHAVEMNYMDTDIVISLIKPQEFHGRPSFGDLHSLVDDIDFNVCRLGLAPDGKSVYAVEPIWEVLKDIVDRRLRIVKHRPEEADRVAKRIAKYESYGYKLMEV